MTGTRLRGIMEKRQVTDMKKIFWRIRQFALSRVLRLTEHHTPRILEGQGCVDRVAQVLADAGVQNALLVTTPGTIRRGMLRGMQETAAKKGIVFSLFTDVPNDPDIGSVEAGRALCLKNGCTAIVAVGGGSVLDCAKMIGARLARPRRTVAQMRGAMRVGRKLPLLIAVPTTAGTGSEVTAAAVITEIRNGVHDKYPVSDLHLIPRVAVLDARLTLTLPRELTAATGMDALTHAVEAYTNRFASKYVKKLAKEAVGTIFAWLPRAVENGQDTEAREKMLHASMQAGIAFTNNFVGYVHALAHAIGGLYGVPHGKANAVLLPAVLSEYGVGVQKKLAELAAVIGVEKTSEKESAGAFLAAVAELRDRVGMPHTFAELSPGDYEILIRHAMKEANPMYPVPVIWGAESFARVLRAVTETR